MEWWGHNIGNCEKKKEQKTLKKNKLETLLALWNQDKILSLRMSLKEIWQKLKATLSHYAKLTMTHNVRKGWNGARLIEHHPLSMEISST